METIESLQQDLDDANERIEELEKEVDGLKDDLDDVQKERDDYEDELDEIRSKQADDTLQGYAVIEYKATNFHDQSLMELIGKILDCGFTTNQIEAHLFEHFNAKLKTL